MTANRSPLADENPLGEWKPAKVVKVAKKRVSVNPTSKKPRKPRRDPEAQIQKEFILWTRSQKTLKKYPLLRKLLFAVPNGGYRSPKTASDMNAEGVEKGVSDILFLAPSFGKFHYLALEFKAPKGRQSDNQKDFEHEVDQIGGIYQLCYSVDEAKSLIAWYYAGMDQKAKTKETKTIIVNTKKRG